MHSRHNQGWGGGVRKNAPLPITPVMQASFKTLCIPLILVFFQTKKEKRKKKNKVFVLCRLEGLYRYIHNGIPVLSNAESKMKNELEEIEEYLKFHRESLQQVHSSQLICCGVGAVNRRLECCYLLTLSF